MKKKKELRRKELQRTILKIGFSAVCSIAVLIIFVRFCIWSISVQKKVVENEIIRFGQNDAYSEAKTAQDLLREYSSGARKIKSKLSTQSDYWEIISEINKIVPEKIYLKELSVDEYGLFIRGSSLDRQTLLAFQDSLNKSELFREVESPISNLVESKNVDFEFSVSLTSDGS